MAKLIGVPVAADRFDEVSRWARERGLSLCGAVAASEYDATQPPGRRARELMVDCDTILLLGCGGRSGWSAAEQAHGGRIDAPHPGRHPIDGWSADVARQALERLGRHGFRGRVVRPGARRSLNFRQLAELVGFGTISPVIGHLLHPTYGPWVSLRFALLLAGQPFGARRASPLSDFEPCSACHRPCVSACPVDTYGGDGAIHLHRCADRRVSGGCAHGCDSLIACPIGAEHRYGPAEHAHRQAHALFTIRRWRGDGWWGLVPPFLRRARSPR